jgi:hypothetical protein
MALYRHFTDCEDLIIRVAQEGFRELSHIWKQAFIGLCKVCVCKTETLRSDGLFATDGRDGHWVISVLGQTHGLILFFRAGVFHSKSDVASKKYIDK